MNNELNPVFEVTSVPPVMPARDAMPVWRASIRMALVTTAGLLAAGLIATGAAAAFI